MPPSIGGSPPPGRRFPPVPPATYEQAKAFLIRLAQKIETFEGFQENRDALRELVNILNRNDMSDKAVALSVALVNTGASALLMKFSEDLDVLKLIEQLMKNIFNAAEDTIPEMEAVTVLPIPPAATTTPRLESALTKHEKSQKIRTALATLVQGNPEKSFEAALRSLFPQGTPPGDYLVLFLQQRWKKELHHTTLPERAVEIIKFLNEFLRFALDDFDAHPGNPHAKNILSAIHCLIEPIEHQGIDVIRDESLRMRLSTGLSSSEK